MVKRWREGNCGGTLCILAAVQGEVAKCKVLKIKFQESDEAARYMTFYPITEWPHVSIVDPRTGENMVTWSRLTPFLYLSLTLTSSDWMLRPFPPSSQSSSPSTLPWRALARRNHQGRRWQHSKFNPERPFTSK